MHAHNLSPTDPTLLRATYPCLVRITDLETEIAALAGSVGTTVRYRWTKRLTLVGLQLMPKTWALATQVGLELAWENEHGGLYSASSTHETNMNAWPGERWSPIEVSVDVGDIHIFTVTNYSGVAATPILVFHVVEG